MRFRFRIGDVVALKSQADGDPACVVIGRTQRTDRAGARALYSVVLYGKDRAISHGPINEAAFEARGETIGAITGGRAEDEAPPEPAGTFREGDRVRLFGRSRDDVVVARDFDEVAPRQWAVFYHLSRDFPDDRGASTRIVPSALVGPAKGDER